MILEVKFWPDPCLKEAAKPVKKAELETIEGLIETLFETMRAWGGMGLAATQCAVPVRVIVIDTEQVGGTLNRAFINPVIKERTEKTLLTEEGCLSFPGVFARVTRHEGVVVETMTLTGETEDVILNGVDAVCLQHELDHLNGIVFFDHLKPVKRRMLEEKIRKNVKKINRKRK